MRPREPLEWLRLARVLAAERDGQPLWVARNRSVSTGYYAVFHALADLCGRELVGAWKPWTAFRHVYRSLDHAHARRVLEAARKERDASPRLRTVADLFTELQQMRHRADYDPGYRITSTNLRALLREIEHGLEHLNLLTGEERQLLAARLIGRPRN